MSHVNASSQVDSTGVDATDTVNHAVRVNVVAGGGGGGGGATTIADGADVAEGALADAAVQGDNPGSVSAKLRGLNKSIAAGLNVLVSDAGTFGPTTMSSGSGDVTVQTPGPGVLTMHIAVSGVTGTIGLTEQFTSGGSFFSGVGGYITAAPFINNPVQNYLKLNETIGLTTATNFVVVLHARGIAVKLINNITVGSISIEGTFKANAVALHPIILVGNAGQSSGFAADVTSRNELFITRVGDNQQLTTGVPNTDGQSFAGTRTTPVDGAIGYLYNGLTWDRPRGDSNFGAYQNLKAIKDTIVSVGSGTTDAGTQRVVLPTDQPALAITAASLPLPANAAKESGGNLGIIANRQSDGSQITQIGDSTFSGTLDLLTAPSATARGVRTFGDTGFLQGNTPAGGGSGSFTTIGDIATFGTIKGGRFFFIISGSYTNANISFVLRSSSYTVPFPARRIDTGVVATSTGLISNVSTLFEFELPSDFGTALTVRATVTAFDSGGTLFYQAWFDAGSASVAIPQTITVDTEFSASNPMPVTYSDATQYPVPMLRSLVRNQLLMLSASQGQPAAGFVPLEVLQLGI